MKLNALISNIITSLARWRKILRGRKFSARMFFVPDAVSPYPPDTFTAFYVPQLKEEGGDANAKPKD